MIVLAGWVVNLPAGRLKECRDRTMLGRLKKQTVVHCELPLTLPDGERLSMWKGVSRKGDLQVDENAIVFDLNDGAARYLSFPSTTDFDQPPDETLLKIEPGTPITITLKSSLEGGKATLWVIEYDEQARRGHYTQPIRGGEAKLTFIPQEECRCLRLAVRLTGRGRLSITGLSLLPDQSPSVRGNRGKDPYIQHIKEMRRQRFDTLQEAPMVRGADALFVVTPEEAATFRVRLGARNIDRALVISYSSKPGEDCFDQISTLAQAEPNRIHAIMHFKYDPEDQPEDLVFHLNQLELLWQTCRLSGLAFDLANEPAPAEILDWVESRGVLTLWKIGKSQHESWLEENVLKQSTCPVLLLSAVSPGSIKLLESYEHCFTLIGGKEPPKPLKAFMNSNPRQVLFGSGSNGEESSTFVKGLDETSRALTLKENLIRLTCDFHEKRLDLLEQYSTLRFPPLPESHRDMSEQGFVVIAPSEMPAGELEEAKQFWSEYEIKSWYRDEKPWSRMIAKLVKDLDIRSVLEFGCNVGRNLHTISQATEGIRLVGLDINEEAVRVGREETGLDLRVGDEATLREFSEGEFDLVFTVSVLDHIVDVKGVCEQLARCAVKNLLLLEITLPLEGKVIEHFDHKYNMIKASTGASYSWDIRKYLEGKPRIWRLDARPCYLHSALLGPYYWSYLAFLDPPVGLGE